MQSACPRHRVHTAAVTYNCSDLDMDFMLQALELVQPIRVGTCSAKLSGLTLFK